MTVYLGRPKPAAFCGASIAGGNEVDVISLGGEDDPVNNGIRAGNGGNDDGGD